MSRLLQSSPTPPTGPKFVSLCLFLRVVNKLLLRCYYMLVMPHVDTVRMHPGLMVSNMRL